MIVQLNCAAKRLDLSQPVVMGILNITPDSFSDGGHYIEPDAALRRAEQMLDDGARIIDIGGESTRPGATPVSLAEELDRVIPVIERLATHTDAILSIDTSKPEVMAAAVAVGADMINDVTALRDPAALQQAAALNVPVCLMHMLGEPRSMQHAPEYQDVVAAVQDYLRQRIVACEMAGLSREQILIDPGFGFGKTVQHNIDLLKNLSTLRDLQQPLVVGLSRKSMLGAILGTNIPVPVDQRLHGSVAAAVLAALKGATILRVHDVKPTVDALKVVAAVT